MFKGLAHVSDYSLYRWDLKVWDCESGQARHFGHTGRASFTQIDEEAGDKNWLHPVGHQMLSIQCSVGMQIL